MKKQLFIVTILMAFCIGFAGCAFKNDYMPVDPPDPYSAPRLVIHGTVSNEDGEALVEIRVSENITGLDEPEVMSYNYAITDAAGEYTIIRYRGRILPTEVVLSATDPNGTYQSAELGAPVTYDTIMTHDGLEPYNGFVTADFVLMRK